MSDEESVWYFPNGDPNTFGSEIPRSALPAGAYPIAEHITEDGRTLTAYVARR